MDDCLSSPSFFGHYGCCALLDSSPSKEQSQQLPMVFVWILALPVIPPVYSATCPACCSPFCLPRSSSLNFHYPNASCMKVHIFVPFLVTLLTNLFTMLPQCVWICHNGVTKCVHTVVDNTTLVCVYLDSRQANYILKNKLLM